MAGKTGLFLKRLTKRDIICMAMMVCFMVSYLPVTQSWYISVGDRVDLSRLILAAVRVHQQTFQQVSPLVLDQTMQSIFTELKIATGQAKVEKKMPRNIVRLTEILPDYPILGLTANLYRYQDFFVLIPDQPLSHLLDQFPPDTPPPEACFVL